MKTVIDIEQTLFRLLNVASIKNAITGGVYNRKRPTVKDPKEDVVINSLPVFFDQVQIIEANINIHVPDLNEPVAGVNQYLPNTARLKTLTDLIIPKVNDLYYDQYMINVSGQAILEEENQNGHYSNIRVVFTNFSI